MTQRLSGCHWDVGWSEGIMDAKEKEKEEEESGEFMEKAEL